MISVSEAKRLILENTNTFSPSRNSLSESLGLVLAENVFSKDNIPFADNSAMDGYAVKFEDTKGASKENPVKLKMSEVVAAGHSSNQVLQNGEVVKIMTGAPIPNGADSVVIVEQTEKNGDEVSIFREAKLAENIRRAGEDISVGMQVLKKGKIISPADLGVLASVGNANPLSFRKPKIAVLATGDEIISPEEPLSLGKVRNSNEFTLCGLVEEFGGKAISFGIGKDSKPELTKQVLEALETADILVTSGGVSMGDFDFVQEVFPEIGVKIVFHKINVKPGKPVLFGTFGEKLVFGLPGNPVSSMVSFLKFVVPAMKKMSGNANFSLPKVQAKFVGSFSKRDNKTHFLRGILEKNENGFSVSLTGRQGSGILRSMSLANCLIEIGEEQKEISEGQEVTAQILDKIFLYLS
ncbi:MAG: molybdopterin molybdenumtransferase MoeA [Calditrichaeota bacterium]|nr:MAG: molybdopterin molybdenumtransferase MoeA [Calditrichota bacterium]